MDDFDVLTPHFLLHMYDFIQLKFNWMKQHLISTSILYSEMR